MKADDPILRTLSVNGERRIGAFQLTSTLLVGLLVPPNIEVPRHYVLAGPTSGDPALMAPRLLIPGDIPFAGVLTEPNVWTDVNTFAGIRLATRTVTADTTFTTLDFAVSADATAGSLTAFLPPAIGSGQVFRLKKIDGSTNIVTMQADGTDLIDGSTGVNLVDIWANVEVQDAALGRWNNERPPTDALIPPDPPPPTPTTLNEVIALLQLYDLCA